MSYPLSAGSCRLSRSIILRGLGLSLIGMLSGCIQSQARPCHNADCLYSVAEYAVNKAVAEEVYSPEINKAIYGPKAPTTSALPDGCASLSSEKKQQECFKQAKELAEAMQPKKQ
ncbi:hypothetical protein JYB87_14720 [Shewanella avicenniae]|uniref:Lipoprotein n=1 Tax=Shewanella avicenniae TaxID=2814294 RepID=A0ABX7QNN5_9GAMM|nr:hypothetical protein [Shewanella avicenniae]QSX32979.1 hypothetical protein JYB87_14720 [Shewanella avicenniae]